MRIWTRFKSFGSRSREQKERDLELEIRNHLDLEAEESGERGARLAFGNAARVKEDVRTEWGWTRLEQVARDAGYGLRQLWRNPVFSVVAIATLALGIGGIAAMFSAFDTILIRPLPYKDADRLVMIWDDMRGIDVTTKLMPAPAEWIEWRRLNTIFSDLATTQPASATLSGEGDPEEPPARKATWNLFSVLDVQPVLGRVFTEDEDNKGAHVVVISYGLWQRRYGSNSGIVGRKISLNDQAYEVIGVMPRNFYFMPSTDVDIWMPASFPDWMRRNFGWHDAQVIARLKPGITLEQARQSMVALSQQVTAKFRSPHPVFVNPLREEMIGKTHTAVIVLLCAAAALLLIACFNLANLLMSRGAVRRREVAVRAALGAGRGRLVAQLLTESLVLATLGTVAGLALAVPSMRFLERLVPEAMGARLALDWRVLAFSAAAALAATLTFGLAPALRGSRVALQAGLRQGGRGTTGARSHWFQHSLIVAETSLAVVLLTCGVLLLQTFQHLRDTDYGIQREKLLTFETSLFRYTQFDRRVAYINAQLDKVRAIPGVINAGAVSRIPFTNTADATFYLLEGQSGGSIPGQVALMRNVSRDYLATVGASLVEGRFFDISDQKSDSPVAIINELFAKRHFPGSSALGKRFKYGNTGTNGYWYTVVGVVKQIREAGVLDDEKPVVYRVLEQCDQIGAGANAIVVHTAIEPTSITSAIRHAIWSLDRNQPLARIQTIEDIVNRQLSTPSQSSALMVAFALFALLLASIGLYGVLSYTVTQRTNEIGVRMALGASSREILLSFGGRGLLMTLAGLAIGLVLAGMASRLMTTLFYGFRPDYVPAVAAVSVILTVVATIACVVPAYRASRIDPLIALRHE
jgi:predicted permease